MKTKYKLIYNYFNNNKLIESNKYILNIESNILSFKQRDNINTIINLKDKYLLKKGSINFELKLIENIDQELIIQVNQGIDNLEHKVLINIQELQIKENKMIIIFLKDNSDLIKEEYIWEK
ncbi:MAG: hypothetical protein ACK5HS_03695 [Mycoplasmatales bacterium]